MARLLMLLVALLALGAPSFAQEPTSCGSPAGLDDGWSLAPSSDVGFDSAKLCGLDTGRPACE